MIVPSLVVLGVIAAPTVFATASAGSAGHSTASRTATGGHATTHPLDLRYENLPTFTDGWSVQKILYRRAVAQQKIDVQESEARRVHEQQVQTFILAQRIHDWTVGVERAKQQAAAAAAQAQYAANRRSVQQQHSTTRASGPSANSGSPYSYTGSHSGVMQCIKNHESGDYSNHSYGSNGASGAYQVVGSTWRTWAPKAGVNTSAAYLASPAQQDAVVEYMLTNGGASNWSPRYGNDPCTVGMGG